MFQSKDAVRVFAQQVFCQCTFAYKGKMYLDKNYLAFLARCHQFSHEDFKEMVSVIQETISLKEAESLAAVN
jgi:hypothetical protein